MTPKKVIEQVMRYAMYWGLKKKDLDQLIELIKKIDRV